MGDLHAAVIEGAVQRIRPKIMTICAILFGLLPIMWSPTTQSGADVMKRIAAPMIGGVITSGILELLIYPVIYVLWRRRRLPTEPPARGSVTLRTPRRFALTRALFLALAVAIGGYFAWQKFDPARHAEITQPQLQAMQTFFTAADATTASLAADNVDTFNQTASKLPTAANELAAAFDSKHPWHALVQQVQSVSSLPKAGSLEDARKSFLPFTTAVVDLAKVARRHADFRSLKIYKCPMAPKPGQQAFWVQLQGPLRNPFYGSEMLDCGTEVPP
jgi:hypothetical protein